MSVKISTVRKIKSHFWNQSFLDYILLNGAVVFPATPDGKPLSRLTDTSIQITKREHIKYWYSKNIKRFVFRPSSALLIAIDLDCKNGKNGIEAFQNLTGINPKSGFHVSTPSGGLHLYFFAGHEEYISTQYEFGIDVKYHALCTLPGSRSDKGHYKPYGFPFQITALPESLKKILPVRSQEPKKQPQPPRGQALELDKIHSVITKQGIIPQEGNRNFYAFQFAKFAKKHNHNSDSILQYLSYLESSDFTQSEIRMTVNSAFRK